MIRLSDILLSYAEAMHHAYGMSADPEGYGLTAIEAVKKIRTRAGFGTNDKFLNGVTDNNFMEKVKQERRIELCFEEHRYFDLRRWMDGNQLKEPIIGMKVEENASGLHYTRITVDEARNFKRLHVLSSYSSESNQGKPFHPTESRLVTGIKTI